jgi:hypothetical protein
MVKISIMGCDGIEIPADWKKEDLDLLYHTVHDTPDQPTTPIPNIHAVRYIAGWIFVRDGNQVASWMTATQVAPGTVISPYCWGRNPNSTANLKSALVIAQSPAKAPGFAPPMSPSIRRKPIPTLEFTGGDDVLDPTKSLLENGVADGDRYAENVSHAAFLVAESMLSTVSSRLLFVGRPAMDSNHFSHHHKP